MTAEQNKKIEGLYLELFDKLRVYSRSLLDSDALAEEAIQEAFRIACQKPEHLCESPNPQGWIFNTLKYTVRTMKSNREAAKQVFEQYLLLYGGEITFSDDRLSIEINYQDIVDSEEFKILKELVIDGKSHKEMADARGITVNACKKRVQRAKERLRKKLKDCL